MSEPKRRLMNVDVEFLSLVNKGANKKKIIFKSEENSSEVFQRIVDIVKIDEEKRMVYGIVYSPDEVDSHGDTM